MTDKKKIISVISLVIVLSLFVTAFLVMKNYNDKNTITEETTDQTTTIKVTEYLSDDVSKLKYTYEGKEYSFIKNTDGTWSLETDSLFPVKKTTVNVMATAISSIEAEKAVENGETETFGFDEPSLVVTGEFSDGSTITLTFGKTNAFNDLVYMKNNTDGKIYMVKSTVMSSFKVSETDLIETDSLPTDIQDDYINSLTVSDEVGTVNVIDPDMGMALSEAMDLFYKLEFPASRCIYTTEEGLADYGIGESEAYVELSYQTPETVINEDGTSSSALADTSFKIIFGDSWVRTETLEDENGEPYVDEVIFHYYTIPGSTIVYSINDNDYEKLMAYAYFVYDEEAENDTTAAEAESES